ncbi:hypothetical protein OFC42_32765, partial [Escherichia coli]|nr:hypothetical protein [Escherichia coli]
PPHWIQVTAIPLSAAYGDSCVVILTIQVAAISSPIGCYARAYLSRNTRNRQPEDDFPLVVYLCLLPPFNRKALPFGCAIP